MLKYRGEKSGICITAHTPYIPQLSRGKEGYVKPITSMQKNLFMVAV